MQSLAINLSVLIFIIAIDYYGIPLFPYIKQATLRQLIFLLIFTHANHSNISDRLGK